jgi:hypothetical protein
MVIVTKPQKGHQGPNWAVRWWSLSPSRLLTQGWDAGDTRKSQHRTALSSHGSINWQGSILRFSAFVRNFINCAVNIVGDCTFLRSSGTYARSTASRHVVAARSNSVHQIRSSSFQLALLLMATSSVTPRWTRQRSSEFQLTLSLVMLAMLVMIPYRETQKPY